MDQNDDLLRRHAIALAVAAVAAVLTMLATVSALRSAHVGCEFLRGGEAGPDGTWLCPDGIAYAGRGLLGGTAGGLVVLAVHVLTLAWHADADRLDRLAVHAAVLSAAVGVLWGGVWLPMVVRGIGTWWTPLVAAYPLVSLAPLGALRARPAVSALVTTGTAIVLAVLALEFPWFEPSAVAQAVMLGAGVALRAVARRRSLLAAS